MAYAEVLDLMKKQAEAFLIPPEELGLQQFDMVAFLGTRSPHEA